MEGAPPAEQVRQRLREVIRRPPLLQGCPYLAVDEAAPAPAGLDAPDPGVLWQRWLVQSEPGPRGRVPVLLARRREQAGRRAVVIVLHGTLKSKEDHAADLERYALQGYVAVSFDTRYRGERGSVEDYMQSLVRAWRGNHAGLEAEAPQDGDEHPFMYDSAWDLSRVVDMLVARHDVDPQRIGATGVSLGGMHVWLGAAADTRIAAVAPAIGVQYFRHFLDKECWQARVDTIRPVFAAAAADLLGDPAAITTRIFEQVMRRICPDILGILDAPNSLRCIAPRPLLVIGGELDPRCPAQGVLQAFEMASQEWRLGAAAAEPPQLHLAPGVEHEVTPAMWRTIDEFLARHLAPGRAAAPASRL